MEDLKDLNTFLKYLKGLNNKLNILDIKNLNFILSVVDHIIIIKNKPKITKKFKNLNKLLLKIKYVLHKRIIGIDNISDFLF